MKKIRKIFWIFFCTYLSVFSLMGVRYSKGERALGIEFLDCAWPTCMDEKFLKISDSPKFCTAKCRFRIFFCKGQCWFWWLWCIITSPVSFVYCFVFLGPGKKGPMKYPPFSVCLLCVNPFVLSFSPEPLHIMSRSGKKYFFMFCKTSLNINFWKVHRF